MSLRKRLSKHWFTEPSKESQDATTSNSPPISRRSSTVMTSTTITSETVSHTTTTNNNNNHTPGYNMHQLLQTCTFPLRIKVVQNTDQNIPLGVPQEDNIQTVITRLRLRLVKCLNNNSQYVYLPHDLNKPLLVTQIEDTSDLVSIFDVMKDRRRLSWLVVAKKFDYKNTSYEPGDILEVRQTSFIKRVVRLLSKRRWPTRLSVISHPKKQKRKLPSYVQGHFKKCCSPRLSYYRLLPELVANKEIPFLITIPKEPGDESDDVLGTVGEKLIALEEVNYDVLFLADGENGVVVQAVPESTTLRVLPVDQPAPRRNRIHLNMVEYRERLIQNISLLECLPVALKDLLPENEARDLSERALRKLAAETPDNGRRSSLCGCSSGSLPHHVDPGLKKIKAGNHANITISGSLPPKPPLPEKPEGLKDALIFDDAVYYRFKECPPVPLYSGHTNFGPEQPPSPTLYLKPVSDIPIPVYDPSTNRVPVFNPETQVEVEIQLDDGTGSGKPGKHDSIKSVVIGRDGYVIVPPIDEEDSNSSMNSNQNRLRQWDKVKSVDIDTTTKYELMGDVEYFSRRRSQQVGTTVSSHFGASIKFKDFGAITEATPGFSDKLPNSGTTIEVSVHGTPKAQTNSSQLQELNLRPSLKAPKFRPSLEVNVEPPPKAPVIGPKPIRNVGPYENLTKPPLMPKPTILMTK